MNNIVEVNRILIKTIDNEFISMTPTQIYDVVMAYSQNPKAVWNFSAAELYRVTYMKEFPLCYVNDIYTAILNHFAVLELNEKFKATTEDQNAINAIYSRFVLAEDSEDSLNVEARKNYLASIIEKATALAFSTPVYPILSYDKLRTGWREAKFNEYEEIVVNFQYLLEMLIKDFQEFIKSSKESGALYTEEKMQELEKKNREVLLQLVIDL